MRAANIPKVLRSGCFCPSCSEQLTAGRSEDPYAICLACDNGHRFFIMPEPPLAPETATAKNAKFPELGNRTPAGIASFWLSDPRARSILNEQLAQLLRAILESRSVIEEPKFSYCPICRESLLPYEQRDIWVQGLRCGNNHSWACRGWRLFSAARNGIKLQAENSDVVIGLLINSWLKRHPNLDTNLHDSVRRVLLNSPLALPESISDHD